ncbi:MAG TPA: LysR substrate-binding domain-containing protein [Paracoccaceae bacterium]|nr:LysR substrate-binding domain-containing protein [Paracoccaceae bacterium]
MENAAADARSGRARPVRITTTRGLATVWMAPVLAHLRAARPDITLVVEVGLAAADLSGHEADIALRLGRPGRPDDLGRRVGTVHCGLYAAESYLVRRGVPHALEEIAAHDVIGSVGEVAGLAQVRRLAEHAAGATPAFVANDTSVQIAAMREGWGLLAAPCCMVAPLQPPVVRVLPEAFDVAIDLRLLINPRLRGVEPYATVYKFLLEACQRDRDLFTGRSRPAHSPMPRLNISADPSAESRICTAGSHR